MNNTAKTKAALRSGETNYLDAIMELQQQGLNAKDAESLVSQWQDEPVYGSSALSNACEQDEGA